MGRYCRHRWRRVCQADDFRGEQCYLWLCDACGKTWELFEDIIPKGAEHG